MNIEDWRSQIRRGTLEYCILLILLRRLQKDGYLTASWQDSAEGLPPRKYYALTPAGEEALQAMNADWDSLLKMVALLKEEE